VKVSSSEAARRVVERVRTEGRRDLVMILGTGCCDSTAPFLYDRYVPEPDAVRVGRVSDVPVFAHRWLADLYAGADGLEIDVHEGTPNDSFSLESEYDCRFTLKVADHHAER
jgi:uncharacterized protein (DUF779 family)